jgi:hypothetical protein
MSLYSSAIWPLPTYLQNDSTCSMSVFISLIKIYNLNTFRATSSNIMILAHYQINVREDINHQAFKDLFMMRVAKQFKIIKPQANSIQ